MKPHKHAELIKAWADGAEIQIYKESYGGWAVGVWEDTDPTWHPLMKYRIKPEPKPDVEVLEYVEFNFDKEDWSCHNLASSRNLKLTFDGETGELKSAEVLK